jgi:proprotein convertase subtilisin/kexin type 5
LYTTNDNSACVASCPGEGSYYDNTDSMHCSPCDVACTACSGPTNAECSVCAAGYAYGTASGYTTMCVEDCTPGEFFDYGGNDVCMSCIADCDVCDNTDTCTTCAAGSNPYLLTDLTCGDSCGMNTGGLTSYYDVANVCYDCVQSECATCADDTACTTCNVGFHLETDASLGTVGTCVSDCGEK